MDSRIPQNNLPINKNLPNKAETDSRLINTTNFVESKNNNTNNKPIISARKTLIITEKTYTREHVGGKGSTLYRLQQAGMNVPEFTTIDVNTTENLEQYILDINSLKPFISDVASFDLSVVNIANIKQYIQNRYSNQPEQRSLYLQGLAKFITSDAYYQQISNSQSAKVIRENYQQFITSLPEDSAIIVRSSGIKEDNYGDAQAGKFESIVHGKQDILQTCLQVLASGFQPHVCSYSAPQPMALILQRCIDCSFGGVAMSRTSLKDHRGKIEFVPGQPKGGVSGLAGVTPYCYLVSQQNDEFIAEFIEGNVASQFILKQQDNNNFEEIPVALTENTNANLTEEQLKQIYQYIKQGEDILLCPADIEFAIAKDGTVYIVQLRPLTVLTGGMDFATETPTNPLATGTLVSEGVCSGKLFYVKNQQDAATIPQGAIIVAEHGEDWMLETSFLQKVGGFIFQQGGTNDHVAITLRQQELPCLIIPDDFAKFKTNNEIVTMACCSFNGVAGAYVVSGNEFADKLATMQSQVKTTYKPRSSETLVIKTPELYFNKPDIAFKNLNDLNYKLLDYFSADSWLTRCFTEKGMLLLAMAPHRIEIIKEATQEIQQMFADFEIFLSGYKQYLQLGIKPKTASKELLHRLIEAEKLSVKFNNIKTRVNNNLDNILQQFTNAADQTINKADFNQILQDTTNIFADTQQLNIPKNIDEVNSLHDCIFWIHKEFIGALAAIAINSGLGIITKHKKLHIIRFSNTEEQQAVEKLFMETLTAPCFTKQEKTTIVMFSDRIILNLSLGQHVATIEMIEQIECDKKYELKLKLIDSKLEECIERMYFFAKSIDNRHFDENADPVKFLVDEHTGVLSLEISNIENKEVMLKKFVALSKVLGSLYNLDLPFRYIKNMDYSWDLAILKQKIYDLSSVENQEDFNLLTFFLGYDSISYNTIINNALLGELCHFDDNNFFVKGKELYNKYENIFTPENSEVTIDTIKAFIDEIPFKNKAKLLYNLPLNISQTGLAINLLITKYNDYIDKNKALKIVSLHCNYLHNYFQYLAPEFRNDVDVILTAIDHSETALQYVKKDFFNNKSFLLQLFSLLTKKSFSELNLEKLSSNNDILIAIFNNSPNILRYLNDKELALIAVSNDGYTLQYANETLKNDRDVVLVAVNNKGSALKYASKNLNNDKDIVLVAVKNDSDALQYASETLKNDRDVVLVAVNNKGSTLKYASEDLKNDKDILLVAIKNDSNTLRYASEDLKDDKDVVLAAISDNAIALHYASDKLKNDKDIVLAAVSDNIHALQYASETLKNDRDVVLAAVSDNIHALQYASETLKNDRDVVLAAVSDNIHALQYASETLKNDRDVVLAAVSNSSHALQYASDKLKNDKDIVLAAVSDDSDALEYASDKLKNDKDVVLVAVNNDSHTLQYASEDLKNDKDIVLAAVSNNGYAIQHASQELQNDEEIILAAIKFDIDFYNINDKLKNNKQFILKAIKANFYVYNLIGDKFKNDKQILQSYNEASKK